MTQVLPTISRLRPMPETPAASGSCSGPFVVFDANAVRELGPLGDGEWRRLQRAWTDLGGSTGWIPHVLAELVASNVAWKSGLTRSGLRTIQRAVRRFDALAARTVLHDVDEVVYRAVYELADEEAPPSGMPDRRQGWRDVIDVFVRIREPEQIEVDRASSRLVVRFTDNGGVGGMQVEKPREFVNHAEKKIAALRKRLGHTRPITTAQMVQDVVNDILPNAWAEIGVRLGIPKETLLRAMRQEMPRVLRSPFLIRQFCENVYYHSRAFPRRKGGRRKPTVVKPNDAPDLAVTTYFTPDRHLVTDDAGLRRLLREVLQVDGLLHTWREFHRALLSGSGLQPVN